VSVHRNVRFPDDLDEKILAVAEVMGASYSQALFKVLDLGFEKQNVRKPLPKLVEPQKNGAGGLQSATALSGLIPILEKTFKPARPVDTTPRPVAGPKPAPDPPRVAGGGNSTPRSGGFLSRTVGVLASPDDGVPAKIHRLPWNK
jgi:hypothetical protein